MARSSWVFLFILSFTLSCLAQQVAPTPSTPIQSTTPPHVALIPRSHEERESRYRAEHQIFLNATVTDASGKPVTGLKAEDFALLDNGKTRPIASFRAVEGHAVVYPAHVILMLDAVNNTYRNIQKGSRSHQALNPRTRPKPPEV
jgi:hypothetical protein